MTDLGVNLDSYAVLATLAPQATSYLCVGVAEGECLRHVVEANPQLERLCLCDTWGYEHGGTGRGSHSHIAKMLATHGFAGTVKFLDGKSQTMIPELPADDTYALSLVDGSHAEKDEYTDLVNVWQRTTWALVVHDARMPPVWNAITRWLDQADARSASYSNAGHGTLAVFR